MVGAGLGEQGLEVRATGDGRREDRLHLGLVDESLCARVDKNLAQLVGDVPPVDVDGDGARLVAGEHGFEVLGRVVELEADVVAGPDGELRVKRVRQSRRPLVELAVRQPSVAADDRLAVGNGVGNELEQVGDVERRYFASLPWPT